MEATEKNYTLAENIIALFNEENCTVKQAEEILSFVGTTIRHTSTVQPWNGSAKSFNSGNDF